MKQTRQHLKLINTKIMSISSFVNFKTLKPKDRHVNSIVYQMTWDYQVSGTLVYSVSGF